MTKTSLISAQAKSRIDLTAMATSSPNDDQWIERLLSRRTSRMRANMIRELLKVVSQPGMISLAGGLPAPESFPLKVIEEIVCTVLKEYANTVLQYGPTEGFPPLRQALVSHVAKLGIQATADDIIITSGSQGSLDALGKIFISPGDSVAVESPTYLGALTAFNAYEPKYVALETDDDGVIPEALENVLRKHSVKFVYLIPTFQNPSGRTISAARRPVIADIIRRYDALLIEDDPYNQLRYRGESIPPIKTLAPEHVAYLGTMSKILAPGMRLGYCIAPPLIKQWMVLSKQGVDLHTSSLDQAVAAKYLTGGYLEAHLPKIISVYKPRLQAMLDALDAHFPNDFRWSKPDGGMFVWAEGPRGFNSDKLYELAVSRGVAFVPGRHAFVNEGQGIETMRLNFSMVNEATITKAISMLGKLIRESR